MNPEDLLQEMLDLQDLSEEEQRMKIQEIHDQIVQENENIDDYGSTIVGSRDQKGKLR